MITCFTYQTLEEEFLPVAAHEDHQQWLLSIKVRVASHFAVGVLHCTKPRRTPPDIPSGSCSLLQGLALSRCSCTSPQRPPPLPLVSLAGPVRTETDALLLFANVVPSSTLLPSTVCLCPASSPMVVPSRLHKLNGRGFFLRGPIPPAPLPLVSRVPWDKQCHLLSETLCCFLQPVLWSAAPRLCRLPTLAIQQTWEHLHKTMKILIRVPKFHRKKEE